MKLNVVLRYNFSF